MKNLLRQSLSFVLFFILIICGSNNSFAQRYWNTAAKFDGTAHSYIVVVPYQGLRDLSGGFTVECWFNCSKAGYYTLFGKNGFRLLLDATNNNRVIGRMQTNNNTKLYTSVKTAMKPNTWYHLACTYDSISGLMSFYINGNLDTSTTNSNAGPLPGSDSLLIGKSNYGYFNGMLDDIRIYNNAVTQSTIQADYRHPLVGAIDDPNPNFVTYPILVMACSFEANSGGPFGGLYCYDGYNNYYPYNVSPIDLGSHPSQTLIPNSALNIPIQTKSYAVVPSDPSNDLSGPMTIEAWVFPQSVPTDYEYIISKESADNKGYWISYSMYDNQPILWFGTNSGATGSRLTVPENQWSFIAGTITNSDTMKLYINGKLDFAYQKSFPESNTDSLYFGNKSGGTAANSFAGYIDAVRISNFSKSQSEIQKDMFNMTDFVNEPAPPKYTASYNFDYTGLTSTNTGDYCYLKGNALYSSEYYVANPIYSVSPILGNNYPGFPDKFTIKPAFLRIPQYNSAGYMQNDSLNITNTGTVSDIKLFVALNHTSLSDLQISLFDPSGDSVLVWNGDYGNRSCYNLTTIFDDNSTDTLVDGKFIDFGPSIMPLNSLDQTFAGKKAGGKWALKITDLNNGNTGFLYGWGLQIKTVTGIKDSKSSPKNFQLSQNYPNPFNPSTKIKYSIPNSPLPFGKGLGVRLEVYDILGRQVATLVNEKQQPGNYQVTFDGSKLSTGIYFYKLTAGNFIKTKKMILLK